MDAASKATIALSKAQATQIYAGLNLWPAAVTASLAEAQLLEDGTYPGTAAVFGGASFDSVGSDAEEPAAGRAVTDFPGQRRDPLGQFAEGKQFGGRPIVRVGHHGEDPIAGGNPDIEERLEQEESEQVPPLEIAPGLDPKVRPGEIAPLIPPPPGGIPRASPEPSNAPTALVPVAHESYGSFSITDWTGYPQGLPKPAGPFRLLKGDEYTAARQAADQANKKMHAADPSLDGLQVHHVQPVKFGGSPTDPLNKVLLTPAEHLLATIWWDRLQRYLEK